MAEAKQVDEWNRTALACTILANINRDEKRRREPYGLHDFHPFLERPKKQPKLASELFARLSKFGQPQVVTEETSWAQVTSTQAAPRSESESTTIPSTPALTTPRHD